MVKNETIRFTFVRYVSFGYFAMHARWLVEIATLFVVQPKGSVVSGGNIQPSALHRYWTISRQRFDRWQSLLTLHRDQIESAGASRRVTLWKEIRPTFEEIFLSDVLTRVISAFGARLESDGIDGDMGPIAHGLHATQEDIRHRCLRLLVVPGIPVEQAVELNRIRFSLEHWTDAFLAQLPMGRDILPYCFKQERTQELVEEAADRMSDQSKFVAWQLMTASCQKWMGQHCKSISANADLNQQLGEAALALLHPDRFQSVNPFTALASDRISTLIDQADIWVTKLLHADPV